MKSLRLTILFLSLYARLAAQDDTELMKQLEKDSGKTTYTTATFKSTRLINGHTVETLGKGILDVRILHRFAAINTGIYNFFGLDQASMRMGFDYGITNNIMVGVGHSTWQKTYDALFKIKILKQSTGAKNMPVTLAFVSTLATRTDGVNDSLGRFYPSFIDMTSFSEQLIVGRKFSDNFSLQFMPIYIFNHNKVDSIKMYTKTRDSIFYGHKRKNTLAFGFGARVKVSKRVAINLEYYYQLPDSKPDLSYYHNSFSIGVDLETGGHIFQMHFTNSNGMTEKSFITDTDDKWKNGSIRFGFNISRVFKVAKP